MQLMEKAALAAQCAKDLEQIYYDKEDGFRAFAFSGHTKPEVQCTGIDKLAAATHSPLYAVRMRGLNPTYRTTVMGVQFIQLGRLEVLSDARDCD